MPSKTPLKRVLFAHSLKWGSVGVFLISVTLSSILFYSPTATAITSSTLNFQARLMNASGSIVPDGNYNIEFKLYDASTAGTNLWTEDYTSTSGPGSSDVRVRVANGYLSVPLGSHTSFPGTINWDQQLYLTMNIGGTGTGSFPGIGDGEMSPRIALSAVPYSFRASQALQLASGNSTLSFTNPSNSNVIALPDASGTVCLQSSSSCGFAASSGSTSYIQNTTTVQTGANIFIQTGNIANATATLKVLTGQTANVLTIQDSAGGTIAGIESNGAIFSAPSGTTIPTNARLFIQPLAASSSAIVARSAVGGTADILALQDSTGATNLFSVAPTGATRIQTATDSPIAFQVLNSGNGKVFAVDTSNNLVRVVTGTIINSTLASGTGALQIGGDTVDNLVLDDNEIMARSNGGTNTLYVQKLGGGLQIQASTTIIKPATDNTTAFQIQKSADGSVVFNADTTNKRIGIGTATPSRTLDVSGEINITGLQPAATTGTGTDATSSTITGGKGGNSTAAGTAGTGGSINIFGGNGGDSDGINGPGGAVTIRGGTSGAGAGTSNFHGNVLLQDAGGYVGIGTLSPTAILHVSGSDGLGSDLLEITDSTATAMDVFRIMDEGAVLARTRTNSRTGFLVQNALGNNVFDVDTTNSRVGIGTTTPGYPLDVVGQVNSSTGFSIAGTSICTSSGCTAASGSGFYVRNQTTIQTAASFFIQGSSGNVTAVLEANGADILDLKNASGVNVATFSSVGNVLIKPSTNSGTAFQIQPAASATPVLIADTSLGRVGINTASPGYALDVNGDINSNTALRVGGVAVCTTTCTPAAGSANYIQNSTTVQDPGNFSIRSSSISAVTGVLQGASGQTADIFQVQKWNGTSTTNLAKISSAGVATFQTATNNTSGFVVQNSTAVPILSVDTANGAVAIQSTGNSVTALKVTDSTGRLDFSVDTSSHALLVGNGSTGYAAPSLLILNSNTGTTSDPSGVDGSMYYNGTLEKFRCYENGAWTDCIKTALTNRYSLSTTQTIPTYIDTKVVFGNTVTSDGSVTVTGGNTFTVNKAGIWSITASVRITNTTTGSERYMAIMKSSDFQVRYGQANDWPGTGGTNSFSSATTLRLAAGDSISVIVYQSSGGNVTLNNDFNGGTNVSLTWLGS